MTVKQDKAMTNPAFDSAWDAICDTPAEAAHMRLRADVMMRLEKFISDNGLTQAQAAEAFGVTQPRVSDLVRRKFNRFSLESLLDMGARAGLHADITLSDRRRAA